MKIIIDHPLLSPPPLPDLNVNIIDNNLDNINDIDYTTIILNNIDNSKFYDHFNFNNQNSMPYLQNHSTFAPYYHHFFSIYFPLLPSATDVNNNNNNNNNNDDKIKERRNEVKEWKRRGREKMEKRMGEYEEQVITGCTLGNPSLLTSLFTSDLFHLLFLFSSLFLFDDQLDDYYYYNEHFADIDNENDNDNDDNNVDRDYDENYHNEIIQMIDRDKDKYIKELIRKMILTTTIEIVNKNEVDKEELNSYRIFDQSAIKKSIDSHHFDIFYYLLYSICISRYFPNYNNNNNDTRDEDEKEEEEMKNDLITEITKPIYFSSPFAILLSHYSSSNHQLNYHLDDNNEDEVKNRREREGKEIFKEKGAVEKYLVYSISVFLSFQTSTSFPTSFTPLSLFSPFDPSPKPSSLSDTSSPSSSLSSESSPSSSSPSSSYQNPSLQSLSISHPVHDKTTEKDKKNIHLGKKSKEKTVENSLRLILTSIFKESLNENENQPQECIQPSSDDRLYFKYISSFLLSFLFVFYFKKQIYSINNSYSKTAK